MARSAAGPNLHPTMPPTQEPTPAPPRIPTTLARGNLTSLQHCITASRKQVADGAAEWAVRAYHYTVHALRAVYDTNASSMLVPHTLEGSDLSPWLEGEGEIITEYKEMSAP